MNRLILNKRLLRQVDFKLLFTAVLIVCFGSANIYSATHNSLGFSYLKLQLLWLALSLVFVYLILLIDYNVILGSSKVIYWAGIIFLAFTDFSAKAVKGASSWVKIGSRAIEPGEFVKLCLVMMLAKLIDDMDSDVNNPRNLSKIMLFAFIPIILIVIQPNLGMALVYFFVALGMIYISGINLKILLGGLAALVPIVLLVWNSGLMKAYQKDRLVSFLNPSAYSQDIGFQLMQSIIGIGSGGTLGKGFLHGTQAAGGFIPEVHTDFIFAVVGEEWGLVGAAVLLLLYGILLYRMFKIAKTSRNLSGALIAIGTASAFLFSILQNIGMTIGIMPIAGITLPLMSYGGSSILANFISIALVLNVGMRRKQINF